MRLDELRSMFPSGTKIYAVNNIHNADEEVVGVERLEIKNLLYGSSGFCNLDIRHIKAVGKDEIEIEMRMPDAVFAAWKKYSDDFYAKEEEDL